MPSLVMVGMQFQTLMLLVEAQGELPLSILPTFLQYCSSSVGRGREADFGCPFYDGFPRIFAWSTIKNGILADCRVPFLCNHFGTCISGTHRSSDIRKWKSDCSPQKNSIAAAQEDCRQGWDTLINVSVASCFKHLIKPVESSPTSPIIWLESPLLYVFSFRSCLRAN